MLHRTSVRSLGVGVVLFLVGVMTAPAWAVAWGPVTAVYDNLNRAKGSGTFVNENPWSADHFTITDLSNDGNGVYGRVTFLYKIGGSFVDSGHQATATVENQTYTQVLRDQLDPQGTQARAASGACVDLGFPVADRCSGDALATFSY